MARDRQTETWYEAVVLKANGDMFRLKWRDYPEERAITRRRNQIALLFPGDRAQAAA